MKWVPLIVVIVVTAVVVRVWGSKIPLLDKVGG